MALTMGPGDDENAIEEPDMTHLDKEDDTTLLQTFQIRPNLDQKFKSLEVKDIIHEVLQEELGGKVYITEEAEELGKSLANKIRTKVKELALPRYKLMVQVVLGEQHGAGVKTASRCLWDADSDAYATDVFLNDSIFCMAVVFAVYFY